MKRKAGGHGGQRKGAGRKHDSLKPWDRIAIAERFYTKLWQVRCDLRERGETWRGRRPVYETDLTIYAEDFPDKVSLHDGKTMRERIEVLDEWAQHFVDWRETQGKLRARGRSEDWAMGEGHWDEWFRTLWDKRMKRLQSRRRRHT
jgi:hypothetical protein